MRRNTESQNPPNRTSNSDSSSGDATLANQPSGDDMQWVNNSRSRYRGSPATKSNGGVQWNFLLTRLLRMKLLKTLLILAVLGIAVYICMGFLSGHSGQDSPSVDRNLHVKEDFRRHRDNPEVMVDDLLIDPVLKNNGPKQKTGFKMKHGVGLSGLADDEQQHQPQHIQQQQQQPQHIQQQQQPQESRLHQQQQPHINKQQVAQQVQQPEKQPIHQPQQQPPQVQQQQQIEQNRKQAQQPVHHQQPFQQHQQQPQVQQQQPIHQQLPVEQQAPHVQQQQQPVHQQQQQQQPKNQPLPPDQQQAIPQIPVQQQQQQQYPAHNPQLQQQINEQQQVNQPKINIQQVNQQPLQQVLQQQAKQQQQLQAQLQGQQLQPQQQMQAHPAGQQLHDQQHLQQPMADNQQVLQVQQQQLQAQLPGQQLQPQQQMQAHPPADQQLHDQQHLQQPIADNQQVLQQQQLQAQLPGQHLQPQQQMQAHPPADHQLHDQQHLKQPIAYTDNQQVLQVQQQQQQNLQAQQLGQQLQPQQQKQAHPPADQQLHDQQHLQQPIADNQPKIDLSNGIHFNQQVNQQGVFNQQKPQQPINQQQGVQHGVPNQVNNQQHQQQPQKQQQQNQPQTELFQHHILQTLTNTEKMPHLKQRFVDCIISILDKASVDLHFFFVIDEPSRSFITETLQDITNKGIAKSKFQFNFLDIDELAKEVAPYVVMLQEHVSGGHPYYKDAIFFLSVAIHKGLLPDNVHHVAMLDTDLKFMTDIKELFEFFPKFSGDNIMALAHEQQPVYRHMLSLYRSKNPGTKVGGPPPDGLTGFNSGVMLLDLDRMRNSHAYASFLGNNVIKVLTQKYFFKGHLGDQDFFSLISLEKPDLFYILPCTWNRQLCRWWQDKGYADVFDQYFTCQGHIDVYHGNCNTPIPNT